MAPGRPTVIREDRPADHAAVEALIAAAFAPMPFAAGTEAALPGALRDAGAAALSLVAERGGAVVGHALFSPATLDGRPSGWLALGPVAVAPALQRDGIGGALIRDGLGRLRASGAPGCIVLGDPGYYARFGFAPAPGHAPPGAPPRFFMALPLAGGLPAGRFGFHPAFGP